MPLHSALVAVLALTRQGPVKAIRAACCVVQVPSRLALGLQLALTAACVEWARTRQAWGNNLQMRAASVEQGLIKQA